ncbi:reverse transcriptase domain-containing protein [Tanacetum coccineum]
MNPIALPLIKAPPVRFVDDNRTMAQLLEAPTEGYEDAIVVPEITADNFELKHGLLTLIIFTLKFPNVPSTSVKLMLFPFSLEGAARIWLKKEPPRSILIWDDLVLKFINKFFPPSKTTNLLNEITRFQQRFDETFYEAWDRFNDLLRACPHHGFSELHQLDTFYNALNSNDQDSLNSAAGGNFLDKMPRDCLRIIKSKSKVRNSRNKPVVAKVSSSSSTPGISPDVAELKDMVKALLLDKKNQTQAPAPVKAVEESCVTCGGAHSLRYCPCHDGQSSYRDNIQEYVSQDAAANFNQGNTGYQAPIANQIRPPVGTEIRGGNGPVLSNNGSTKDVQPPVVQVQPHVPNSEPVVAPVSVLMPNLKLSIPCPSRRNDERRHEKASDQIEKFYEIFKDLSFKISLTDALILMQKFASTPKALIGNKEKLSEMARTSMDECLALADLGASINLMPLSVWKKLSLSELTPTCMTLELADRSISQPIGIAEDVYVKVGKFQFPADFVVVDFDADPRVPLILGRSFLKTGRALIDVYEGELTLRVGKEAVTFNLDQTSRYSSNYDDNSVNRIDVIDMACEEYSQEVLGFSDVIASGNPTPYYDPIVSTSSPTLTPFGDSDFLLEEVNAFLALEDDPTSPEVDHSYYDSEGDILLLEAFLNDDPSLPPPTQGMYLPEIRKELKIYEAKNDKSLIDEPLEVELKDLPPHLEYAFLEGDDKLPVIIAKDLSVEEKSALIKVLIKGINLEFCTHKILMEEDYKPVIQHQRRVNSKIHDLIKKEVEKLLNAGLIYLISDSPWVSPVYCVPKKGGFTVVENDENKLIPTRLVTGWHVCIDYHFQKGLSDKAKVDVIAKVPHPHRQGLFRVSRSCVSTNVSYKDFSKIPNRLNAYFLRRNYSVHLLNEFIQAFENIKKKLTRLQSLNTGMGPAILSYMCDCKRLFHRYVLQNITEKGQNWIKTLTKSTEKSVRAGRKNVYHRVLHHQTLSLVKTHKENATRMKKTCKDSFKRFTDEPILVCLPLPKDNNDEKEKQEVKNLAEPTAKRQTRITPCLKNFKVICKESIFHSNKTPQVSSVFAITSTLPSIEPKDSLIMGDEHLSTFSTEETVPIPRESEDTSRSDSKNVLPSCDDLSSFNVPLDDSVIFSNPLFEFDVNFNTSDINPLFDEVLEDIECKDSYDSNLDESTFLVTPLSDSNKDECLTPGDDIEILLHHDPSTPLKSVASILEGFIDDPPFEENDDLFDWECKTNDWKRILYDAPIDEAECFDPGGDNDEIDAFLAIEVPTYIEGYFDSEGDVIYLESLLSDDTTHNLSPEVFFNHEPQHDTFSPKSDPLHHEFTGELLMIPPGIVREHEDYINRMEEIDIFSGPDDLMPPGIESDFDSEEDIIDNLLNDDPIPEYERLTFDMEPDMPVINNVDELNEDKCFDPGGGEINVEVDDSFTFVTRTFLPYLTYPEVSSLLSSTKNEDTIFDPVIFT